MKSDFRVRHSPLWAACDGTGIDAYELQDPDTIHLLTGMFRRALKDLLAVLKKLGGDAAVHELNMRAQTLPRYVLSQVLAD